jgi:hypothetical protein
LVLVGFAFAQGGLVLVGFVAAAILVYAFVFAIAATVVTGLRSPSLGHRFASNLRKALVDGPLFLLAFL